MTQCTVFRILCRPNGKLNNGCFFRFINGAVIVAFPVRISPSEDGEAKDRRATFTGGGTTGGAGENPRTKT